MPKKYAQMILQSLITLASASLGLVAALAWNDAIKATIKKIFEADDSLAGLYTYAILATLVAVIVVLVLSRVAARVGGEAAISREAEG
ncbi:MAG: hypothetical protein JST84_01810 [Acidobacteria bacterium]|nr:hypothetical protein [Acidobacteriota bacterium]